METTFVPAYVRLLENGELARRVGEAYAYLAACTLCGWECRLNRLAGKLGVCRTGEQAQVSSYGPHLGEEDPLRGWHGSGTIFFAYCNMRCQYCQNYDISQAEPGEALTPRRLADMMLDLQAEGCHNINLVSPSHVVAQILAALLLAAEDGLRLPLVYNTGGFDSPTSLRLLEGVIDIYLPDMKYAHPATAKTLSKISRYPQINQAAVLEMHRQVGDLQLDERGLALRGLMVRHLVLPNNIGGTGEIIRFIAEQVSPNTYLNLMNQYRPDFNIRRYPNKFPKLNRPLNDKEYQTALDQAQAAGLTRLVPPTSLW